MQWVWGKIQQHAHGAMQNVLLESHLNAASVLNAVLSEGVGEAGVRTLEEDGDWSLGALHCGSAHLAWLDTCTSLHQ